MRWCASARRLHRNRRVRPRSGGGRRSSVHLVDISQPAIDVAKANIEQNRNIARRSKMRDYFAARRRIRRHGVARRLGEQFDVVIIDPPSFAQNEKSIPKALSSYRRLARAGLRLTVDGGLLVQASCSSRITIDDLGREMRTASSEVG